MDTLITSLNKLGFFEGAQDSDGRYLRCLGRNLLEIYHKHRYVRIKWVGDDSYCMLDLVSSCGTTHPKTMLYDLSEQEIESRERIYASCEVLKVLTSTVSKPAPTS